MDQEYAIKKYKKKYREIYEMAFDGTYHVEEVYKKVENDGFEIGGMFSLPNLAERIYCGSTNNFSEATEKAIKKTTFIFAKDILESKMMEELDENSLYNVIYSLHKEGILTFKKVDYKYNGLLMSVVTMRYISIIPKLIKLDVRQSMQDVLVYSIQEEDLPLLNALVEAKKINGLPIYAYGLARYTAKNKSTDILEFLIKNNMSEDILDMKSAKEENNQEMINVLLEKSPYLRESYREAILDNDIELAKKIIKTNRVDVKKDDIFIKFAVTYTEDTELVQMLIDAGANVNAKYDVKDAMSYRACISYRKAIEEGIEDFGNILTKAEMQHKFKIADLLRKAIAL